MAEDIRKYNRSAAGCRSRPRRQFGRPPAWSRAEDGKGWPQGVWGATPRSPRRQHHHHLATLEARFLLDLGKLGGVVPDAVEELGAQFLVRHFTAAEAQRDLGREMASVCGIV